MDHGLSSLAQGILGADTLKDLMNYSSWVLSSAIRENMSAHSGTSLDRLLARRARRVVRSVYGNTASVEGVRLGNTQIGGMYIDNAYLYEIH